MPKKSVKYLPANLYRIYQIIIQDINVKKTGRINYGDFISNGQLRPELADRMLGGSSEGNFYYVLLRLTKLGILIRDKEKQWGEVINKKIKVRCADQLIKDEKVVYLMSNPQITLRELIAISNSQVKEPDPSTQNKGHLELKIGQVYYHCLPNSGTHTISILP